MVIGDREARDADRFGRVVAVAQGHRAALQGHRGVKNFKRRAHFIDAQGGPVEARLRWRDLGTVGVEIRQRDERVNLTAVDRHHHGNSAHGAEIIDLALYLLAHDMLKAHIDAGADRCLVTADAAVQGFFQPGEAGVVNAGETGHVRGQRAMGVDAPFLGLKMQAGNAQAIDREGFGGGQMPFDPHEAFRLDQFGGDMCRFEVSQHAGQLRRRRRRVDDLGGIGIE